MKTKLGKELSKLRLDLGMRQKVMAYRLGYIASTILSRIESGDKKIPEDFNDRFVKGFPELGIEKLRYYEDLINQQRGYMRVIVADMVLADVSLVTMFATKFSSLSVKQKNEIRILLEV